MSNAASERGNGRGEEEDPRRELVEQLLQYKMYKYMAYELKDRQTDADMILYKDPTIPEEVKKNMQNRLIWTNFLETYIEKIK